MDQMSFSEAEFQYKKRKTRREKFLERMDALIPWGKLEQRIAPFYPKGKGGRPPYPLAVMLKVHCMQLFYNLSDPAMEDALYEIESMRRFAGLKLSGPLPDETTILNFRRLLENNELCEVIFQTINQHLSEKGLFLREGTIVDASIIDAPSSTKNNTGQRDPEMHQTKKGNQWYFGMKMHIGVDDVSGAIHSLETTPANHHDITQGGQLLHGDESRVWGDSGYTGIEKREEHKDREVDWFIAMKRGKRSVLSKDSREEANEQKKAGIRAFVEHPFRYIKQVFHYGKVRYRGQKKNRDRLYLLAGFSNLLITEKYLAV